MRMLARTLIAGAAIPLAGVALAGAAAKVQPPQPGDPAKPVEAGATITFTTKAGLDPGSQVFLEVSTRKQREGDGTLEGGTLPGRPKALKSFSRKMAHVGKGRFSYRLAGRDYEALEEFWAATPGTYYWVPFTVDCEAERSPAKRCVIPGSKVNRIVVEAASTKS